MQRSAASKATLPHATGTVQTVLSSPPTPTRRSIRRSVSSQTAVVVTSGVKAKKPVAQETGVAIAPAKAPCEPDAKRAKVAAAPITDSSTSRGQDVFPFLPSYQNQRPCLQATCAQSDARAKLTALFGTKDKVASGPHHRGTRSLTAPRHSRTRVSPPGRPKTRSQTKQTRLKPESQTKQTSNSTTKPRKTLTMNGTLAVGLTASTQQQRSSYTKSQAPSTHAAKPASGTVAVCKNSWKPSAHAPSSWMNALYGAPVANSPASDAKTHGKQKRKSMMAFGKAGVRQG